MRPRSLLTILLHELLNFPCRRVSSTILDVKTQRDDNKHLYSPDPERQISLGKERGRGGKVIPLCHIIGGLEVWQSRSLVWVIVRLPRGRGWDVLAGGAPEPTWNKRDYPNAEWTGLKLPAAGGERHKGGRDEGNYDLGKKLHNPEVRHTMKTFSTE